MESSRIEKAKSWLVQFRTYSAITVKFYVKVNVWTRSDCICDILYFKVKGIDTIEISKLGVI